MLTAADTGASCTPSQLAPPPHTLETSNPFLSPNTSFRPHPGARTHPLAATNCTVS
jgi:hypothetical protein